MNGLLLAILPGIYTPEKDLATAPSASGKIRPTVIAATDRVPGTARLPAASIAD